MEYTPLSSKILKKMLIGELSAKSGLPRDTIRFYEKHGLIQLTRKQRRENNYKEYSEAMLDRLFTIKRMKSFGFTLNEAAFLLDMVDANVATCNNVEDIIDQKIKLLDSKIADMIAFRDQLIAGVERCRKSYAPGDADNCAILVSDRF